MEIALKAENINMYFKGITAVSDYFLNVEKGTIQGLIGTNGAGKTTVFNILTGLQKPSSGRIFYGNKDITSLKPDTIASLGITRTFQNLRLFGRMTVLENVITGAALRKNYNICDTILGLPQMKREEEKFRNQSMELLKILGIDKYSDSLANSLPYGSQRKLEIARALASHPNILLLDEPAAGMNPNESISLMETIREIRRIFNLTIIVIEHDMKFVMNLCDNIQVLCYGKILAEGIPEKIKNDSKVIDAYLGRADKNA